ncbi:DUF445 domain-containing protein [Peribacillus alkalitolerans]|uniref:DUF445 domain-containing protein n=1 Tax=Peribacillus alkalitolerans TaxID=1550385 RepID=UPI0013CFFCE2|nr:DUF445 domain-containing protein [Peribacillus alkalitolerans]
MTKQEKKSKYLAKISLGIMGAGFFITIPFQDSLMGRLLQGGFEAGLVGGLADWFAVTALFRHPLGIPIPHSALLPKNRDRMIRAVISMLENDWLTKESIQGKFKQIKVTDKLLQKAEKELYSGTFKNGIASILEQVISNVDLQKISPFIEKELKNYLYTLDTGVFLQPAINQALARKMDDKAMDYILNETEQWVSKEDTKVKMGIMAKQFLDNTEADGFMKFAINSFSNLINEEKLGNILQSFIIKRISNLNKNDNKYRLLILARIRKELQSIHQRKDLVSEINHWKDTLINDWNPGDQITEMLRQLQKKLVDLIQDEAFIEKYVLSLIKNFLDRVNADPLKIEGIENWIHNQISYLIDKNHSKIGILVKENLEKLDNETLIDMLENNVGKDLQWIRVNGAICGFIIGILVTIFKAIV